MIWKYLKASLSLQTHHYSMNKSLYRGASKHLKNVLQLKNPILSCLQISPQNGRLLQPRYNITTKIIVRHPYQCHDRKKTANSRENMHDPLKRLYETCFRTTLSYLRWFRRTIQSCMPTKTLIFILTPCCNRCLIYRSI